MAFHSKPTSSRSADDVGSLQCLGGMAVSIELPGGFEQAEEFVEVERSGAASPLGWFAHAPTSGGIAVDPGGVLGLVKDLREDAQCLVDRLVSQGPDPPAISWVDQGLP